MKYKIFGLIFAMVMKERVILAENIFSDKEQKTIAYYDKHASDWEKRRDNKLYATRWQSCIDLFHKFLPIGSILELGSGDGREAQVFLNLGYSYIGTDVSSELLKIAQKRNPLGTFIQSSLYFLPFEKSKFDAFWAAAVLLHIPRNRIDDALSAVKLVIKPGGIGFISLKEGDGDIFDEATGRYFTLYKHQEFIDILQRNGFVIKNFNRMLDARNTWLCFYVQI